ncbi:MAG: hypothetical protein ABH883_01720 [Candidatus Omnitrophota bacterium]
MGSGLDTYIYKAKRGIKSYVELSGDLSPGGSRIHFEGDAGAKEEAIEMLDAVLKTQGDFGVYGDLSGGLSALASGYHVKIIDRETSLMVSIYPESGTGHDFAFTIEKTTKTLENPVVGEITLLE